LRALLRQALEDLIQALLAMKVWSGRLLDGWRRRDATLP